MHAYETALVRAYDPQPAIIMILLLASSAQRAAAAGAQWLAPPAEPLSIILRRQAVLQYCLFDFEVVVLWLAGAPGCCGTVLY